MTELRKETMIDELRTLTHVPDVLHLDIGHKGKLHTYKLVKPRTASKAPKQPTKTAPKPQKPSLKQKISKLIKN